jgi:hypothetical protein
MSIDADADANEPNRFTVTITDTRNKSKRSRRTSIDKKKSMVDPSMSCSTPRLRKSGKSKV